MCEQAEEIQKEWKPEVGDYCHTIRYDEMLNQRHSYTTVLEGDMLIGFQKKLHHNKVFYNEKCFWLPTQEQLLKGIMNSDCYALRIDNTLYSQNENFGIRIFKQFGHYNIVLENSPSEFAYNWITWKEDSLNECLLDVYMFRLYYKYWDKGKWVVGLWNREDRRFNPIKEKWVKAE